MTRLAVHRFGRVGLERRRDAGPRDPRGQEPRAAVPPPGRGRVAGSDDPRGGPARPRRVDLGPALGRGDPRRGPARDARCRGGRTRRGRGALVRRAARDPPRRRRPRSGRAVRAPRSGHRPAAVPERRRGRGDAPRRGMADTGRGSCRPTGRSARRTPGTSSTRTSPPTCARTRTAAGGSGFSRPAVIVGWSEMARPPVSLAGYPGEGLLLVAGREDYVTPALRSALDRDLGPRLTVRTLDVGHMVFWDAFEATAAIVAAFLAGEPVPAPVAGGAAGGAAAAPSIRATTGMRGAG